MKSLLLEGTRLLNLKEVEKPKPNGNEALVYVEAVSIGGSEYLGFNNPGIRPLPSAMGHGFTGTTPTGERVAVYPLSGCGECGFCLAEETQLCSSWSLVGVQSNGGFSQQVVTLKENLFEIPDSITWEQSIFIEPFANSINAWQRSNAIEQDSIAIIGCGSLGMGLIACAHQFKCKDVHVAELSKNRRSAAIALGATQANSKLSGSYDIVFDTVGSVESREQAIEITKKGGKCVFMGFETPEATIDMSEITRFQKTIIGSFVYSKTQFFEAIELVKYCKNEWVTNITFEQVEDHLAAFLKGDFSTIKIALRPNF